MIERIYRLNGKSSNLEEVLNHLEYILTYQNCNQPLNDMGIDFEDVDKNEEFYVEIEDTEKDTPFILQSKLYNTEEEAIKWFKDIDYKGDTLVAKLMKSEKINDTYGDMIFVRILYK